MADITDLQAAQTVKLVGADSTGVESSFVAATTNTPTRDASGIVVRTMPYEPKTYYVVAISAVNAANKSMLSIVNTSSTAIIKIHKIYMINNQTTAATGQVATYELRRITGHSGGTQLTTTPAAAGNISPYDLDDTLDAGVTARTGATVSGEDAAARQQFKWSTDEWGTGTQDVESNDHANQQLFPVWENGGNFKPFYLRQNQGLHLRQNGSVTAGSFDVGFLITEE
jgi:hypothetical protein